MTNTIGLSEKNLVATFTRTIPILILFLKHPKIIPYTINIIAILIVNPIFPVAIPKIQSNPNIPNVIKISEYTTKTGANFIRKI